MTSDRDRGVSWSKIIIEINIEIKLEITCKIEIAIAIESTTCTINTRVPG